MTPFSYERPEELDQALALQPFIEGRVYGATAVWRRGELLAWLGFEKIHCWPGDFGPASLIRLCAPPDMEAQDVSGSMPKAASSASAA